MAPAGLPRHALLAVLAHDAHQPRVSPRLRESPSLFATRAMQRAPSRWHCIAANRVSSVAQRAVRVFAGPPSCRVAAAACRVHIHRVAHSPERCVHPGGGPLSRYRLALAAMRPDYRPLRGGGTGRASAQPA
jgi:hypothetical protein